MSLGIWLFLCYGHFPSSQATAQNLLCPCITVFFLKYHLEMSHPDLFHLSSLFSPPPPGVACFSQCIYPCVSCLSVPVHLVCFQVNQRFSRSPAFCILCFSSPPGFDPCLFLDFVPTCLTILPALTTSLSATLYLLK